MWKSGKSLGSSFIREGLVQVAWSYWPVWGAPLMMGLIAFTEGYNWTVIFLAALVALAMIAVVMNNVSRWLAERTIAGKVDFTHPLVAIVGSPIDFKGIKMGVVVRSLALFPLDIRIDAMETQIGDRVPTKAF